MTGKNSPVSSTGQALNPCVDLAQDRSLGKRETAKRWEKGIWIPAFAGMTIVQGLD
jgi:hypothetical protein